MAAYQIKEVYYTLQGEGANTGRAAVFCRFTGCNLWTGREKDRGRGPGGCSQWCDTDFVGTNGPRGGRYSTQELASKVRDAWEGDFEPGVVGGVPLVVCTGGEPLLQLDAALVEALHKVGFSVAIETNGTLPIPAGIDWVCMSPKAGGEVVVRAGDELKFVYPQPGLLPEQFTALQFKHWFLQPLDDARREENTRAALDYCRAHPRWRLSLQTHKLLSIP